MVLAFLLAAVALGAEPEPFRPAAPAVRPASLWERPYAVELTPTGGAWIREMLVRLDDRLAGPRASPVFRDDLAWMDARWAVTTRGGTVIEPTHAQERDLLAIMGTAAGMAAGDLLDDTLARNETLSAGHSAVRGIVSPAITFRPKQQDKVGFAPPDRGERDPRFVAANLDYAPTVRRPRPPRFTTGASLRVRDWQDDEETPLVDASVYASAERVILQSWRFSVLAASQQWVVTGRQSAIPGWDVVAQARSFPRSPEVGRWSVGTVTDLPLRADGWQVRTSYSRTMADAEGEGREQRVTVELRAILRWNAPEAPDRPALGHRWDRDGPPAPGSYDPNDRVLVWLERPDPVDDLVAAPLPRVDATAEADVSEPRDP